MSPTAYWSEEHQCWYVPVSSELMKQDPKPIEPVRVELHHGQLWITLLETKSNGKRDAVAQCLAIQDDRFISAADWQGQTGAQYRARALKVLETIERYDSGQRSGGLPSNGSRAA